MRILLLSAASSVHTVRWANAFAEQGNDVHLATQHPPLGDLHAGIAVHRFPHQNGLGYLLNGGRLQRLIDDVRPDVVNAHYATGYGSLARSVGKVPLVLNVWGSDVFDFPNASPLHRWWVVRNLRRADHIVSTSEVMADQVLRLAPELERPTVVPFGVDMHAFSARTGSNAMNDDAVIFGTVKTLAHKYGIDTLIKAFALVAAHLPSARLRITGDGPLREELERMVSAAGLVERVTFVGPVAHAAVPDELRKLDVFVALSRSDSESFGVAVIEASACALPVVVTNAGGLPEVVQDGVTGFVVGKDDPSAAAEKMLILARSSDLRGTMGQAGRGTVAAKYEWNACVQRMTEVLRQAIEQYRTV